MGTPTIDLDRYSPVPLYHQVATQLEAAIRTGELEPGDRLENEIDLAEQLQVSRPTLRRAIEELVRKGLLVRKRGFGTQVVQPRVDGPGDLASLFDNLKTRGHNPETRVLRREIAPAPAEVALALGITEGTPVVTIERLRLSDGEPLAVMRNWLPIDVAPFSVVELEQNGLYELLRDNGYVAKVAFQRVMARLVAPDEASILGEAPTSPALVVERTTTNEVGRTFEFSTVVYRASRFAVESTYVGR